MRGWLWPRICTSSLTVHSPCEQIDSSRRRDGSAAARIPSSSVSSEAAACAIDPVVHVVRADM